MTIIDTVRNAQTSNWRLAAGPAVLLPLDSLDDKIDNLYYYMQFISLGLGVRS